MGEKIPLVDLKANYLSIKNEIDWAISEVIESSSFIKGSQLGVFEKNFASYCKARYCVGTSSGTSALYLALTASGIKPGDEVITVPETFIATAGAISATHARVKFVDVDDYHLMNADNLRSVITSKTRAIVPVHLHGQIVDMDPLFEIAEEKSLVVIEDAAQAHGADSRGKRSPIGDVATYSFFPAKNLGAFGDAGAVVTNNEEVAEKVQKLADHGRITKYDHDILGFNHRLDTLHAAILNVKLRHLDEWVEKRRKNAFRYGKLLNENDKLTLPKENGYGEHAYHLYVVRSRERDKLRAYLEKEGIQTGIHYPIPLHLQKAYLHLGYEEGSFPVAEQHAKEILSLPMYPELSEEQINYACDKIKEFYTIG
ncbi:MAG: DegT/DnrJ/EryC1/StrS family aminotransferase [Nanoarchaeota archaeon]